VELDARPRRLTLRPRALLVTELSGLESLFVSTPKEAVDRPALARRLAEDYVELEEGATIGQASAGQENPLGTRARSMAEKYYSLLATEYPSYAQLDEALYCLAREYQKGSDGAQERKTYLMLIQHSPSSKFVPRAYLAFGEMFFREAHDDPNKWDPAAQAYQKVVAYPPPENTAYGYGWYKLAHVYWNEGDVAKARDAFQKAIEFGDAYPQVPKAAKIAEIARRDMGMLGQTDADGGTTN
jgi:tetratricopeptide (TPR) repeat protein